MEKEKPENSSLWLGYNAKISSRLIHFLLLSSIGLLNFLFIHFFLLSLIWIVVWMDSFVTGFLISD
jgi:hypothetical protein